MAPEQAVGKKDVGPPADFYALGAILYECLTGRPPFLGSTPLDTVLQVLADEPASVRRLQPGCPRDLETICHKCLHKEPGRRYATAMVLGEDLQRFQEGLPVQARPVGRLERGWRWCHRNPVVAGLLATVALLLLLGAGGGTGLALWALTEKGRADNQAEQARTEARRADTEKIKVEQERDRAEWSAYVNRITLAQVEWEHGSAELAWGHLQACQRKLCGWEYNYLANRFNKIPTFRGHTGQVLSVAFSPDGKRIVGGSADQTLKVWEADKGRWSRNPGKHPPSPRGNLFPRYASSWMSFWLPLSKPGCNVLGQPLTTTSRNIRPSGCPCC